MEGLERQRPQSSSAGRDDQRHEEASREGNVGSLITAHEAGIAITGIGMPASLAESCSRAVTDCIW